MAATIIVDLSEEDKKKFIEYCKEHLVSFQESINRCVTGLSNQKKDIRDSSLMYAFVLVRVLRETEKNLENDDFVMKISCHTLM